MFILSYQQIQHDKLKWSNIIEYYLNIMADNNLILLLIVTFMQLTSYDQTLTSRIVGFFFTTPLSQIWAAMDVPTRLKGGGHHVPSNTYMCEWGQVQ